MIGIQADLVFLVRTQRLVKGFLWIEGLVFGIETTRIGNIVTVYILAFSQATILPSGQRLLKGLASSSK